MKWQNGITLVALVITIVVMLIIAGVALTALGDNGVLGQGKNAVSENKIAKAKEEVSVAWTCMKTQYMSRAYSGQNISMEEIFCEDNFNEQLSGKGEITDFVFSSDGESSFVYTSDGTVYKMIMQTDGEVRLDGEPEQVTETL